jgi:glycosyltransferase involved in cell wall biosynthesis
MMLFAMALMAMYENQDRCKEMGEAALQRVQTDFTWDAYGERIINGYSRILRQQEKIGK